MAMVLQQALRGLCYKSGWSYAVFWKLKRRSRMVLTWEDGFYEFSKSSSVSNFDSVQPNGGYHMMNSGGKPGKDGPASDIPGFEDQIGLAVARMSYHVYSLGEGIIGRVAFTGKHQWVFGERGSAGERSGSGRSGRAINEKFPAGWQQQFTAGIKTIAVVAVPQGVVQLGSTEIVMEDLTLVSHVRSLFGTLQSVPGAFLSDYVPESQGGRVAVPCSLVMPMPMMMIMGGANDALRNTNVAQMHPAQMSMNNMSQAPTTAMGTGSFDMRNICKPMMPVRPQLNNPFLPSPVNPLNSLSLQSSRIMPRSLLKDSPAKPHSLLSTVSMAVGNRQGLINIPFTNTGSQASGPGALGVVSTDSSSVPSLMARTWNSSTPIPPVSQSKVGTLFDRTVQADPGMFHQLHNCLAVSGVSASEDTLMSIKVPIQSTSIRVTSSSVPKFGGTDGKPSQIYGQDAYGPAESCRPEASPESSLNASEYSESVVDTKSPRERSQLYKRSPGELPVVPTRRPSPNVEISKVDLTFRSPSSKVPTESGVPHGPKWSHLVTYRTSQTESLDVSRACVSAVNQFVDDQSTERYCQPGEAENVSQETFRQSTQNSGDVAGFANPSVPVSNGVGNGIQGTEKSTGGESRVNTEMSSKVSSENHKTEWDYFSALLDSFPIGDELSQALRPRSSRDGDRDPFSNGHPSCGTVEAEDSSEVQTVGDTELSSDTGDGKDAQNPILDYDIFKVVSDAVLVEDSRSEPLLEAVVAGVSSVPFAVSVPPPSRVGNSSHVPNSSACTIAVPREPECMSRTNESYCAGKSRDTLEYDTATGVFPCKGDTEIEKLSGCGINFQRENKYKASQNPVGLSGDEGYRRSEDEVGPYESLTPAKRQEDFGKVGNSRKKARHGDALRPRPKDRQQIQDRVKELREIVPNACKCSIDALLERTIKHMNFLQSVTQRGEQWKVFGDLKEENAEFPVEDAKTCSDLPGVEDKLENGDCFSLELGKLNGGCPVVVQNLNKPRQMLVGVLCEEGGLFLEIADAVRGLGLTILKGAMESRSGKTWVRFIVEAASRDIHRVEVLWNLMQLLQPTSVLQQKPAPQPNHDRPSNYTDPNGLHGGAVDSTSSSLSSSFRHMLRPSVPLQMTAR